MWDEKFICHQCVHDKYVRQQIKSNGNNHQFCSYCQRKRKNLNLEHIVKLMNEVFDYYYDIYVDNFDTGRGENAQDVICDELGVEYEVAEDIYHGLCSEYNPYNDFDAERYNDDYLYRLRNYSSGELDYNWGEVTKSLLNETRFFNHKVNEFLNSLFIDIDKLKTKRRDSPVRTLSEDVYLYRARVFEDLDELKQALAQPEKNFGPPPSLSARSGRMNAQGISVFYGATSVEVAIAEVRPPVGSIVVTAPFFPLRQLKVLDISALDSLSFGSGSKFDPLTRKTSERAVFFRTLSRKLTLPAFGKKLDSDYLITQVVADYLGGQKFNLDGVSFKSTQVSADTKDADTGYNVVLFNKSSGVQHANNSSRHFNVELYEHVDDDIFEFSPEIQLIVEEPKKTRYMGFFSHALDTSDTLGMRTDGMTYHRITGVKFRTSEKTINQGKNFIKPVSPGHFDELSDF